MTIVHNEAQTYTYTWTVT